jgi:hypothetical protein
MANEELISVDQMVDAYWEHYSAAHAPNSDRADRVRAEALFWAGEMVDSIINAVQWTDRKAYGTEPVRRIAPVVGRLELIEKLAQAAPDEQALAYLGAGPLEEYLGAGPDLDLVDQAARRDSRFRTALKCAWYEDRLSPEDAGRLRRFAEDGHAGDLP